MLPVVFVLIAYISGSLPFSVWLGKLFLHRNVLRVGDGNPGAANVFRAGGRLVGLLALVLDISKAAVPVGLAYFNLGLRGAVMCCIALAPVLGHVFSPFLGFKGGKAISAAFGAWIGLTLWKVSLPGILCVLLGLALFTTPGWMVMAALGGILAALLLWMPDPLLLSVWVGEVLILAWTHRIDLRRGPRLRPWVVRIFHPVKG
jgi:acyl phosphate:glycerol-3-phosphate acyltransferase